MFLLYIGQLSPREVKALGQGYPMSDRDDTKVSFLIMPTIIWLSSKKCRSSSTVDLEHIWLLSSVKGAS